MRLKKEIEAIPALASGWRVEVFRDREGRLGCLLHHRLERLQFLPVLGDAISARKEILFGITHSSEIPILNLAPLAKDPRLLMRLRGVVNLHDWSFEQYCDVIEAFRNAERLTTAEMDWLMTAAREWARRWPAPSETDEKNINNLWGVGQLPPWHLHPPNPVARSHAPRRSSRSTDGELMALEGRIALLPSLQGAWLVRVRRRPDDSIACELLHDLAGRAIEFDSLASRAGQAFTDLRRQLAVNREIALIADAPPMPDAAVVGSLRQSAMARGWAPTFFFEILQILQRSRLLSKEALVWVMEAGPAGDPHWRGSDAASRLQYRNWRLQVMPAWKNSGNRRPKPAVARTRWAIQTLGRKRT